MLDLHQFPLRMIRLRLLLPGRQALDLRGPSDGTVKQQKVTNLKPETQL